MDQKLTKRMKQILTAGNTGVYVVIKNNNGVDLRLVTELDEFTRANIRCQMIDVADMVADSKGLE